MYDFFRIFLKEKGKVVSSPLFHLSCSVLAWVLARTYNTWYPCIIYLKRDKSWPTAVMTTQCQCNNTQDEIRFGEERVFCFILNFFASFFLFNKNMKSVYMPSVEDNIFSESSTLAGISTNNDKLFLSRLLLRLIATHPKVYCLSCKSLEIFLNFRNLFFVFFWSFEEKFFPITSLNHIDLIWFQFFSISLKVIHKK